MGLDLYWMPIRTALIMFPFLAFLLLLPWLIYTYRKFGFLSFWTSTVVYSFIFYGLCIYFLVILPLPEVRNNCDEQSINRVYQVLVPFTFVSDIMKNEAIDFTAIQTYPLLLKDRAFLQVLFNVFLFLPLGVYLRYFGVRWKKALLIGFGISLFFEITQRTGLYFIYACPYRLFDVDDLIMNTFGTLLGFVIAPVLLFIFPSKRDVEEKSRAVLSEPQVRPFARLLALFVDLFIIGLIGSFGPEWFTAVGYLMVFVIFPLWRDGTTPGSRLMRFRLVPDSKWGILVRASVLYGTRLVYRGLNLVFELPAQFQSELYNYQLVLNLMALLFAFVLTLGLFVHGLRVVMLKRVDYFYFDRIGKVICRRIGHEEASE